jgi:hypothetical protein
MVRRRKMTGLSEKNWEYLADIKKKNNLNSIDEALENLRRLVDKQLDFRKRKVKIIKEIEL